MTALAAELDAAVTKWDDLGWPRPGVVVVSGSGLGIDLGDTEGRETRLSDWLPFETRQVEGHSLGTELVTPSRGKPVLYYRGRLHSYQGYDAHQVVFCVRLGLLLGAHTLIMTNAAGGTRASQEAGQLVLIRDQINMIGLNPLRGEVPTEWGPQFPDMVDAYDPELRTLARTVGREVGLDLAEGVYAGLAGPSFETPAEVRMMAALGADLVGMSTVLEVIAARHMGARCLGLSLVANLAAGVTEGHADHAEVLAAGKAAAGDLQALLGRLVTEPAVNPD